MIETNIVKSYQTAEYGKFAEILDSRYPAVSVTRYNIRETVPPVTSIDIYPKYAVLSHITNFDDHKITLSADNITVELQDLEKLAITQNTLLFSITSKMQDIKEFINDLEGNTFDTASACDDVYRELVIVNSNLRTLSSTNYTISNPTTAVDVAGEVTITEAVTAVVILTEPAALKDLNNNNVTVTSSTSSLNVNVTNAITAKVDTSTGFPINFADNATVDAFQRLRVSEPVTLFDSKQLHQMSTLFWSNTSLNGNVYHTGDSDPSITLSVSADGGYAIRQTTQRFNYQSGKSMLYMFTGILNPETNIIKRYGCFASLTAAPFTPNVGLYFEASNGTIHCVQNNTGFLVPSVSASRNEWNIDKLDGTGPSGQTLELSGTNIFVIDYEWLGVGRVRYGVVLDGRVWYCHKINNTGKAGTYLRSPNQPIRAELRQTGTGTGSMKIICSTVISEGGSDFSGVTRSIDTESNTIASGTRSAILGVRLQHNKLDSVNQIINAGVISLQQATNNQAPYKYELLLNPAGVTGGTWTDIIESNFQRWRGNVTPTIDTGFVLATGFGSVGAGIDLGTFNLKKFLRIGTTINGIRDELYLVVTPLSINNGVFGSLSFIESD